MALVKACRICLITDVKMYSMDRFQLRTYYEEIMDLQIPKQDFLPVFVCYECAASLYKHHHFRLKCIRGQALLQDLLSQQPQVTELEIRRIDRCLERLQSSLSFWDDCGRDSSVHCQGVGTATLDRLDTENRYVGEQEVEVKREIADDVDDETHVEGADLFESSVNGIDVGEEEGFASGAEREDDSENVKKFPKRLIEKPPKNNIKRKKTTKKAKKVQKVEIKEEEREGKRRKAIVLEDSQWRIDVLTEEEQRREFSARADSANYRNGQYKCEKCKKGFMEQETFNNHMVLHDPSRGKFECDLCKMRYKMLSRLKTHMKKHRMRYHCRACPFVSNVLNAADRHRRFHEGQTFECEHCGMKFRQSTSYLTHVRTRHRSEFVCAVCGASFVNARGLNIHSKKTHRHFTDITEERRKSADSGDAGTYCAECDMRFLSAEAYDKHKLTSARHTDIVGPMEKKSIQEPKSAVHRKDRISRQPVTCEQCGQVFHTDQQCIRHYKLEHPGMKYIQRYVCEICGATKALYAALLVHQRVHTDERPFPCPQCHMRFKNASNRDRHMVRHTGERRHACSRCDKRFTLPGSLKTHFQTVHLHMPHARRPRRPRPAPPAPR